MFDVCIIGAGVTGASIARELSRYNLKTVVVERALDVCEGTSKANSGIVHAGFDAEPGTLKARLNAEGNRNMEKLSRDLDFPFKRNGSLVICWEKEGMGTLEELLENGRKNGVEGLTIITGDEARKMEPNLSEKVVAALFAPTGGIVCPFGLTLSLAENAVQNGVEFKFDSEVTGITKNENSFTVSTSQGDVEAKVVINAAGVYADKIHHMVSKTPMEIVARRGEYCLYDKQMGKMVEKTIFQLPSKLGKGVLFTPTVHGNLMVGPTAADIDDKEATCTTAAGLNDAREKAALSVVNMPAPRAMITAFSGLRAHEVQGDFIIGEASDCKGFVDVAGIESPGLSCAPVIGEYVASLVLPLVGNPDKKADFTEKRKGIPHINELPMEEREALIKENPAYAAIVCRCEMVTEGEILDAIHGIIPARTLDGIKRRTRAGMGRCQAGFCTPRNVELIAREHGIPMEEVVKSGRNAHVL